MIYLNRKTRIVLVVILVALYFDQHPGPPLTNIHFRESVDLYLGMMHGSSQIIQDLGDRIYASFQITFHQFIF